MIQRIQTLLLTGAFALMLLFMALPYGTFSTEQGEVYSIFHNGLMKMVNNSKVAVYYNYSMSILSIVVLFLIFLTIFSYRNRMLQIKICGVIVFLLVVIGGSEIWQFIQTARSFTHYSVRFIFFAPYLAIALTLLARRFIRKDEELVRSADRIR